MGQVHAPCRCRARAAILAATALFAASAASGKASADKYPDRPIKIIVPFAPGGSVDILARLVGQKLTERWGQTVSRSRPAST